ncbi:atad1, partial [Symbiodinium pilosum]
MDSRIYLRAGDGTKGPLRDVVAREKLEGYIKTYGDFADLWMPWKASDNRAFGFVTFRDPVAAQQFVQLSPHCVPDATTEIIAKWRHGQKSGQGRGKTSAGDDLQGALQAMKTDDHDPDVSLKTYFAPRQTKQSLIRILKSQDEAYQKKLDASVKSIRGKDVPKKSKPKLHLFHGPPATGKTQAMKVIAAEAGLRAINLKLGEPGYGSLKELQDALNQIDEMSRDPDGVGVAVLIDEAEQVFRSRSDMKSTSVKAEAMKEVVRAFLEWTDGLQTRNRDAKPIVVVMATNLRDRIDEAIQSRVGESVQFSYPTFAQCKEHFAANAPIVQRWHWQLAMASRLLFMDFRELEAVHDLVCERDAEKPDNGTAPGDVGPLADYLPAIWSIWWQRNRKGSKEWRLLGILKLITWQLPFFSWQLRVVSREMRNGVRDTQHFRLGLMQFFRGMLQRMQGWRALALFSMFTPHSIRVALLFMKLVSAAAANAVFFRTTAQPADADPRCSKPQDLLSRIVQAFTVGVVTAVMGDVLIALLLILQRRSVVERDEWTPARVARQRNWWFCRRCFFWAIWVPHACICILYVLVFLANVSRRDAQKWLESTAMSLLQDVILKPLSIAALLGILASLALACMPQVQDKVRTQWLHDDEQEVPQQ